jgi:competence protein ComEC
VAGERINGFKDAEILVFNPPAAGYFKNENDNSIVMKLIYKDLAILFCGDITSVAMEKVFFYGDLLRADVLKVPHHGGSLGNYAVVKRFFEKISPRLSIVNSGAGSDEIFEVSRIADILTHLGSKSYSINRDGAAIVVSGGGKKGNKRKNQLFYILP